jgi:hypothetical protein
MSGGVLGAVGTTIRMGRDGYGWLRASYDNPATRHGNNSGARRDVMVCSRRLAI